MCRAPAQVGNGRSCQRRWQTAAMWWRTYPEELLMCSGWAASPRQERDLSVMLQHLLLCLLTPKANISHFYIFLSETRLCLVCLTYRFTEMVYTSTVQCTTATTRGVTMFSPVLTLLYRDSHSSHPDWVTGVKGHRVRTTNHPQELQFPLWDQQVGFSSRSCNFCAKLSVTSLLFIMINMRM